MNRGYMRPYVLAADALEKITRLQPRLFVRHRSRLLSDAARVDQPSVQWHLAQILSEIELTPPQRARGIRILKRNLEHYDIVNLSRADAGFYSGPDLVSTACRDRDHSCS